MKIWKLNIMHISLDRYAYEDKCLIPTKFGIDWVS